MVIFLAGLQGIPRQLYEAAEIDGVGPIRRFFWITFPLLMPTVFLVVVMWSIGAMQMFTQSFVMTGGGPAGATSTVVYQVYLNSFLYLKLGYGSAESVVLFMAILVLTLINSRLFSRYNYTL
jgi:ABC-type sugar transport system permease subunit